MSVTQQPYSTAARGKLPIPAWIKMPLIGAGILGSVSAATWFFVWPHEPAKPTTHPVDWTTGVAITLPKDLDGPATVPGPAPDTTPGPSAAPPPTVHRMQVWGTDDPNYTPPPSFRDNGPSSRSLLAQQQPLPSAPGQPRSEYASMLVPSQTESGGSEASVDADDSMLLAEGATFECIPDAPTDTQLPGGLSCTVGEDVWSHDGSNVLIDKYARVTGEVTRGLGLGQDRAFILWRKVRSRRVHAELNSPATDQLGEIGAPGVVDEHLWQKIKGAILLTGIESAGNVAQNLAQSNGNSYVNFSNGQSLASTALQHDINIPTTLWRGQGWPLRVYVQHDIQFHRAYNNVMVAGVK